MEKRRTSSILVVCIMLGLLVGESRADFKECYVLCFLECAITPGNKLYSCATKCLAQCIFSQGSSNNIAGKQITHVHNNGEAYSFCQLGCAISLCSNISTVNKPAGARVASCVNSCGKKCTINYTP